MQKPSEGQMVHDSVTKLEKIKGFFSDGANITRFIIYFLGIMVLLGIPTLLIPNNFFHRMTPISLSDYVFFISTAALSALYIVLPATTCSSDGKATAGSAFGFLAFACPICNHLLVLLLGYSFLLAYFNPLRPVLGLLSIFLLAYVINKKLETVK